MRLAETVTFGGSALDRAAHLRSDPKGLAELAGAGTARHLLVWRGKPLLLRAGPEEGLARLSPDHPILSQMQGTPIFLGQDEEGVPLFAHDFSHWQPEGAEALKLGGFFDRSEQTHPALQEGMSFVELRTVMARLSPRDAELAATAIAMQNWHRTHRFCAKCGAGSEMVMGGWQRSCGSCGAQHFPRTDPVVIMCITHGNSVLMGRSPGWPEGMYSLLAGFVEPGETIEAAVRREVLEESGIAVGTVEYLASQPWPFPNSLMFGCRGEALSREITIDPAEIEEARWVSREEMLAAYAGQHATIAPPRKGAIAGFILRNWLADRLD